MTVIQPAKTKLADIVMPWVASNASVWPSQHDVHAGLLDEIRDLEAQRTRAIECISAALRIVEEHRDRRGNCQMGRGFASQVVELLHAVNPERR